MEKKKPVKTTRLQPSKRRITRLPTLVVPPPDGDLQLVANGMLTTPMMVVSHGGMRSLDSTAANRTNILTTRRQTVRKIRRHQHEVEYEDLRIRHAVFPQSFDIETTQIVDHLASSAIMKALESLQNDDEIKTLRHQATNTKNLLKELRNTTKSAMEEKDKMIDTLQREDELRQCQCLATEICKGIVLSSMAHWNEAPSLTEPQTKSVGVDTRMLQSDNLMHVDALIKKGQMEMAKGAFKTQLEVLEKVHPEQYQKYKKIKIDDLAADAVMQQAEIAKLQPKTGNPMVDMLNENGIPIASSLRGIEQAIKTQKEMETQDPSELIAKAVLEKFQTQILPGLVANIIAGRNPFKIPQQMRQAQAEPAEIRRMALQSYDRVPEPESEDDLVTPRRSAPEDFDGGQLRDDSRRSLVNRLRNSPRLRSLLENPEVMSMLSSKKLRDQPLHGRALAFDGDDVVTERRRPQLDPKSALVLGLNEMFGNDDEDDDDENEMENSIRRSPLSISSPFVASLKSHPEVKAALEKIKYRVNDVEKYLMPKPLIKNPNPQPGFFVPRKLPTRPRKMLPLVVGINENEESGIRRMEVDRPLVSSNQKSRVLTNLKNNPNIAPLFMDGNLEEILTGREILTPEQKGKKPVKQIKAYPRLFGMKTYHPIDSKISQIIEERPVPPMMWTPKGRHTRLRWVGATEKEIPGIGTRFVLPSLDPTMPAVSTAYSTQGRARDEWDTMFKIPNTWKAGDDVGFKVKTKSQRFIGGNGGFEMPAAHQ
ncbi:unnamed protein product [Angiostrongylus costaricensis]|uniref:TPR_REGION domain-containing protein n=1 Tax=Angiostrongylus costaricensis TaxID=334426 RepID=A0A158PFV8_ANGCS|nr:unnamed protein product [Angiostrongylus costaricensis]